jgi:hypothetical protein
MIGGWLFCGLYMAYQARTPRARLARFVCSRGGAAGRPVAPGPGACVPGAPARPTPRPSPWPQAWWFLAVALGAFTFLAVSSSFFLVGRQYLYPPMVVAAFVGERPRGWGVWRGWVGGRAGGVKHVGSE